MARPDNLSDGELVVLIAEGDAGAFDVLWKRYSGRLKGIVSWLARQDEVEDLVQETAVRAFTALLAGKYEHQEHFLAWTVSIARNAIIDARRRSKWAVPFEEAVTAASPSSSPERHAIVRSLMDFLDAQLDECLATAVDGSAPPPEARIKKQAFMWYYADDYTLPEVTELVCAEYTRHGLRPPTGSAVNNWLGGGRLLNKLIGHLVKNHAESLECLNEQVVADAHLTEEEARAWKQAAISRRSPSGSGASEPRIARVAQIAEKKIAQQLSAEIGRVLHEMRYSS